MGDLAGLLILMACMPVSVGVLLWIGSLFWTDNKDDE